MLPSSKVAQNIANQLRADPLAASQIRKHFRFEDLVDLLDLHQDIEEREDELRSEIRRLEQFLSGADS